MRSARLAPIWALALSCGSQDEDPCPPSIPSLVLVHVTVTEGSSTVVPLYAGSPLPSFVVTGDLDTVDHAVATLSPTHFGWDPASYPPHITVFGVDDGSADAGGIRGTEIDGVVWDCGGGTQGGVLVVDRESLQVVATPWEIEAPPGTTAQIMFQLTQMPAADIEIALRPEDASVATVSPTSLALGSADWDTGETATVTAAGSGHTAIMVAPGSDSGLPTYEIFVDAFQ